MTAGLHKCMLGSVAAFAACILSSTAVAGDCEIVEVEKSHDLYVDVWNSGTEPKLAKVTAGYYTGGEDYSFTETKVVEPKDKVQIEVDGDHSGILEDWEVKSFSCE